MWAARLPKCGGGWARPPGPARSSGSAPRGRKRHRRINVSWKATLDDSRLSKISKFHLKPHQNPSQRLPKQLPNFGHPNRLFFMEATSKSIPTFMINLKIQCEKTYFQKMLNMRKPLYLPCRTQIPEGYPIWKAIRRERTKTEKHVWNRAAVCNEK